MSIDLKFNPDLASFLSLWNSGSRACWDAISCQLMPKSPMALTTQLRSAVTFCLFAADAALLASAVFDELLEAMVGSDEVLEGSRRLEIPEEFVDDSVVDGRGAFESARGCSVADSAVIVDELFGASTGSKGCSESDEIG